MAKRDYYDVLGVSRTATTDQIRSAYRKLARKHHPDVNKAPGAAARLMEAIEAYEVLSDQQKRQMYDLAHATPLPSGPSGLGPRRSGERAHTWPPARQTWLAVLVIVAAVTAAYWNSFQGEFIFDDLPNIVNAGFIRDIWQHPHDLFLRMRPVANLITAENFAICRRNPWGYHAVNFAIHMLAALALFGVVRRTLLTDRLRERFARASTLLACTVATIWAVHPLTTESVTYIIQRDESLMGLFYLLSLYCVIRAHDAKRPIFWSVSAVVACALGMGAKQVMITAPLVVLAYDRIFLSESFKSILRRKWPLYLCLFGSWLVIVVLMATQPIGPSIGGEGKVTPLMYAAVQPGVICKYMELSFWPVNQCLDYWWPPAIVPDTPQTVINIAPYALVIAALLAATVLGLWKCRPLAFLGIWFFLILAPTSTILPIADVITERRMYLPLAAVVALAVMLGFSALSRLIHRPNCRLRGAWQGLGVAMVIGAVALLTYSTMQRNRAYRNARAMWQAVLSAQPGNPRAMNMAGYYHIIDGDLDTAEKYLRQSLKIRPNAAETLNNMGIVCFERGDQEKALEYYNKALENRPQYADPLINIGLVYFSRRDYDKAIEYYQKALAANPFGYQMEERLGRALMLAGRPADAIAHFRKIVQLEPEYAPGYVLVGETARREGNNEQAITFFLKALQYQSDNFDAYRGLGKSYEAQGRLKEAADAYAKAAKIQPGNAEVQSELGFVYGAQGQMKEAAEAFEAALAARPKDATAHLNLGMALGQLGQAEASLAHLREATVLAPDSAPAHYQYGMTLLATNQKDAAVAELRAALSLEPKDPQIKAALEQATGHPVTTLLSSAASATSASTTISKAASMPGGHR